MADTKLTNLTAIDAIAAGDMFYIVDDPGGTPLSKKSTAEQVRAFILQAQAPQGRATLTTGVAVTTTDVSGATSIYYTPAGLGRHVPIWNGSAFVVTDTAGELTLALDNDSGHTGYHQSGKGFDLYLINDAGTVRFGSGPAWASDTSQGTGAGTTELELKNGIWTNKVTITIRFGSASGNTVSVAANQATYVSSFYATADGQASDTLAKRLLFNAYNQTRRSMFVADPVLSFAWSTATYQQYNNSSANQFEFMLGLPGVHVSAHAMGLANSSGATRREVEMGIGLDSSTVDSSDLVAFQQVDSADPRSIDAHYNGYPGIGRRTLRMLQKGGGADTQTWFGTNSGAQRFKPGFVGHFFG